VESSPQVLVDGLGRQAGTGQARPLADRFAAGIAGVLTEPRIDVFDHSVDVGDQYRCRALLHRAEQAVEGLLGGLGLADVGERGHDATIRRRTAQDQQPATIAEPHFDASPRLTVAFHLPCDPSVPAFIGGAGIGHQSVFDRLRQGAFVGQVAVRGKPHLRHQRLQRRAGRA